MSDEEVSAETKINIATYFVMSSPTGEVHDVLTDVEKLVNDKSALSEETINKILKDYNVDQMVAANDPNGTPMLVSAYGQVDANNYLNPTSNQVVTFNHKEQKFTKVTDQKQSLDASIAKYRAAAQKQLDTYLESHYKTGKCVALVYGADNGKLTICISAKNVHLANFWTGGWRSAFSMSVGSQGSSELKGNIKYNVHYFEDGNVQLHTNTDKTATINVSDADATAAEIIKAVSKIENDFQSNLETMYVNMHSNTFKSMRRFYPVTRQPMVWSVAAHNLANEVQKQ